MLDSSMKASLMEIIPTLGMRYQQGFPRRVCEESIMSSETRKKAWRSSISQPRVAAEWYSLGLRGRERRMLAVSITLRPRLHFPPRVLCFTDWNDLLARKTRVDELRKRTSWYHFRAFSGVLYCFVCSVRSRMRDEKTASKSFRFALGAIEWPLGFDSIVRVDVKFSYGGSLLSSSVDFV